MRNDNRPQFPSGINEPETPGTEDIRCRWPWVEPSVWTDRMLTALEQGVKGGKWYCVWDKVLSLDNLRSSWERVERNNGAAGVDHVSVKAFARDVEGNLERIRQQLKEGTYVPLAVRRTYIEKPGSKEKRPLGIPAVRDRIVQGALRHVLEPIFERDFHEQSYGFRPGRSCKDALRRVDGLLKQQHVWVIDADIKGYFDSIPHGTLMQRVREKVSDGAVLRLVEAYLQQEIFEDLKTWSPETGTPQGAVLSPLLANLYLDPLDHLMAREGLQMVRYADDFVILCTTEEAALRAMEILQEWTEANGLTLHPTKTRLVDMREPGGFDFLGYHFENGRRMITHKSKKRLRQKIRERTSRGRSGELQAIIRELNPALRGWFNYFKHSEPWAMDYMDRYVRHRLRRILDKRNRHAGMGIGLANIRWPNAFFAKLGLFSLKEARAKACQSARR